jgi:HAMP domain-containing protein
MSFLLNPAISLMRRLRLLPKFLILSFLFAAPTIVISGLLVQELNKSIAFTHQEQFGVQALDVLQDISRLTQEHRGWRHLGLAGNQAAIENAHVLETEIQNKYQVLNTLILQDTQLGITEEFKKIQTAWQTLLQKLASTKARESYTEHSALLEQLAKFHTLIADRTKLSLDPQVDTYYLIGLFAKTLPELASEFADTAARGAPYIDTGLMEANEDILINANVMLAKRDIARVEPQIEAVLRESPQLKAALAQREAVLATNNAFLERTKTEILSTLNQSSGTAYLEAGIASVNAWFTLAHTCSDLLQDKLHQRLDKHVWNRNAMVLLILALLLFACYLLSGFYLSFSRQLQTLSKAVSHVTQGDLSRAIQAEGKDEIACLSQEFDAMRLVLARLVNNIRQSTDAIANASSEIAQGNADLSTRTEQ